jgi:hypothetical protein
VPLLIIGTKQCCDNIFRLVENTKQIGKAANGEKVIIIENEIYK